MEEKGKEGGRSEVEEEMEMTRRGTWRNKKGRGKRGKIMGIWLEEAKGGGGRRRGGEELKERNGTNGTRVERNGVEESGRKWMYERNQTSWTEQN